MDDITTVFENSEALEVLFDLIETAINFSQDGEALEQLANGIICFAACAYLLAGIISLTTEGTVFDEPDSMANSHASFFIYSSDEENDDRSQQENLLDVSPGNR